jgi:hypothetical protein
MLTKLIIRILYIRSKKFREQENKKQIGLGQVFYLG